MKLKLYWPLKRPFISQGFGQNLIPLYKELGMAGHNGLDLPCPVGEPIYAAHDGIITYAGQDGKEGWGVVMRTLEPYEYKNGNGYLKTIYWHLIPPIPVKVGQQVMIGDCIGFGDTTGIATGSHLHFGLKPIAQGENEWAWYNVEQNNGYYGAIDPEPYMQVLTAYHFRTHLQRIAEIVKTIGETIARLIALRKPI